MRKIELFLPLLLLSGCAGFTEFLSSPEAVPLVEGVGGAATTAASGNWLGGIVAGVTSLVAGYIGWREFKRRRKG